ncbi:alcohol dehydrogenase catalytic domain-containing protein [Streptomyces neyagawaensis]|uniref:alcohol dehydrogenase catalytic domain-containing protein n=1 Tax=Streptomyces neyagawaensis TaxID=42238 RepID=UPI003EBBBA27
MDSAILAGHAFIEPPFALGHECVAPVVDIGDAVTAVAPGDLVVVPRSVSCGTCGPRRHRRRREHGAPTRTPRRSVVAPPVRPGQAPLPWGGAAGRGRGRSGAGGAPRWLRGR